MDIERIKKTITFAGECAGEGFGSAAMVAGLIAQALQLGYIEPGYYEVYERDGEPLDVARRDDDFIRWPQWASVVCCGYRVTPDAVETIVGCGVHYMYIITDHNGELVNVVPDEFPSERFWGGASYEERSDGTLEKCSR